MTINVRETGALLAAAAAIGVWLGFVGVAHAESQCPTDMTTKQCDLYTSCLSVLAKLDVPAGGSWDDPGGCRRSAYEYTPSGATAEPPTARSTVEPTTTAPRTIEFTDEQDRSIITRLTNLGYNVTNPASVISGAHAYCLKLVAGESTDQAGVEVQGDYDWDRTTALQVTSSAMLAYPDCF